ncbi:hypothetical protein FB45DRAFT_210347 [Roridomyces roridus]|uniref:F-box domain-containing protein n=1 Tax=Roridomyces roridus TaxID=1738132 RepID=A0AAD7CGG0_9AGAR|nr:hypothetical protein FB45DRAFT_210347 [Roridomyces roridus]
MASAALPAAGPETLAWVFEAETPLEPSDVPREVLDYNEPAELNAPSIYDFISRGISHGTRLDSKIAALRAALKETIAERDLFNVEIMKHRSALRAALSPLRHLPTEILSAIFALVGPVENLLESGTSGPWCVSAVCSRWRAIALSLPSLWTDVSLDFRADDVDIDRIDFGRRLPKLELHLERSGHLPLAIEYYCYSDGDPCVFSSGVGRSPCPQPTLQSMGEPLHGRPRTFIPGAHSDSET